MTKHTKRDKIWSAAIHLSKDGKFTVKEVLSEAGLEESSERTARDVLITMNERLSASGCEETAHDFCNLNLDC